MENNPKKSKAFIITFILIILLLLAGYYLFKNRSSIFDTKGSTTISKVFAPLLGTSKGKDLTVINPNTNEDTGANNITGIVITDQLGNKIVRAQAGEDLKKGDVLYISGFNANKDPIVMKAIASDKNKSLVFGVAGEDIKKGDMGNIIIEGILTGVPTNRIEITLWMANNTLYLSDKIFGGMTKNAPFAPSFVVNVGSVIKVDPINGSIRIGGATNINTGLVNNSDANTRNYFNSIFGTTTSSTTTSSPFILNPINIPGSGTQSYNYPEVTVTAQSQNILSGESTEISWVSKNTTSCNAGKGNGTGVTGSFKTGALTSTKSFSVSCTGPNGTGGGNVIVYVGNSCPNGAYNPPTCDNFIDPNAMTVTITSDKDKINSGESTLIKWSSINTVSCKLSGGGLTGTGTENNAGVSTGALTYDTSYTILCTGKDKSAKSADVTVRVINSDSCPNGAYNPPTCDNFIDPNTMTVMVTADKESVVSGDSTFIRWSSANAVSCKLSGGGLSATGTFNRTGVSTGVITADTSYTVLCTNKTGSTKSADITVKVTGIPDPKLPVVTVTATPDKIDSGGTSTISWTSINTDKDSCYAGVGNGTGVNGSFTTPVLNASKSFTVSCTGPKGKASNSAFVTVNEVAPPVITKPQCSDGLDNDNDGKIDADDPDCHEGGVLSGTYIATQDSESTPPAPPDTTTTVNACADISNNPLVFTEDEKARLDVLLRQFYLISSSLKTAEDITTISNEIDQNQNFINQIQGLTNQCYDQIDNSGLLALHNGSDPVNYPKWVRHGNPWYSKATDGDFPYSKSGDVGYVDYSQLDGGATPAGYKVISGYYYGTLTQDAVYAEKIDVSGSWLGKYTNFITFGVAKTIAENIVGDMKYTTIGKAGQNCNDFNNFTGYGLSKQINDTPDTYLGHYSGSSGPEANSGGFPGDSLVKYDDGGLDRRLPQKVLLEAGCSWKDGVDLKNTERVLNIW